MKCNKVLLMIITIFLLTSCKKSIEPAEQSENPSSFEQIGLLDIGNTGAAEISSYCSKTKKLFVVNNSSGNNKIDVIDFSDPANPVFLTSINVAAYGGLVNSVDVKNGKLAAAIEAVPKTDPGKVVVFETGNYSVVSIITVGSLPDMITYSPDGKFILTADEGEPNSNYSIDPLGTVSIILVNDNYSVTKIDFSSFSSMEAGLVSRGLRKFGPGASFAQDMEPEYITVSEDSRTAWVTLQENNAIARINLITNLITDIYPLGFKNYNLSGNTIDPSDRPLGTLSFNQWPVYGIYMPDGIAVLPAIGNDIPYLFTANEGDAREYSTFTEEMRIGSVALDPVLFPNATTLKLPENLGRLTITRTLGDIDNDNDYDALYSLGARSFSVWNGNTGALVFDSKNELEQKAVMANFYDDDRSDNKGVEPEGIAIGEVGKRMLAFVGMERADAVAIYDVSNPQQPVFLQILATGDAPEGVLFISSKDSPNKRSLLVVSSENDGVIRVYSPSVN